MYRHLKITDDEKKKSSGNNNQVAFGIVDAWGWYDWIAYSKGHLTM